jgi:hypothetical protein
MSELLNLHKDMLMAEKVSLDMSTEELLQFPAVQFARLRKLMERSIAVSARRNVPGQATTPVLLLVELLRWQRDYDGSEAMWWEWNSAINGAHDRIVNDWLDWHARFYSYEPPTIAGTVARLETLKTRQRGGGGDG